MSYNLNFLEACKALQEKNVRQLKTSSGFSIQLTGLEVYHLCQIRKTASKGLRVAF